MQLLMLQFVDPTAANALPVFSHELGVLAGLLASHDIHARLLPLRGFDPEALRGEIIRHRAQCVLADVTACSVTAGRRTAAEVAQNYGLPVVVVGEYATCRPEHVISWPGVTALVQGECERSMTELLLDLRDGAEPEGIPGAWIRSQGGVIQGPPPALEADGDALPIADRDLFDHARLVAATGEAHFRVATGCNRWCGFCTNDAMLDLYQTDCPIRRRSIAAIIDEMRSVWAASRGLKRIVIDDHSFTSDAAWLDEFAPSYRAYVGMPYRCHVQVEDVSAASAGLLAASGCQEVHMQVGCGSRFIREEIFAISASNEQIVTACQVLRGAGVKVLAEVFVGCPYESDVTLEETFALLQQADVHAVRPLVYYPKPGTRARELCEENGWVSGRGEENFWLQRSVLDMPSMPAARINAAFDSFASLLKHHARTPMRRLIDKVSARGRLLRLLGGR